MIEKLDGGLFQRPREWTLQRACFDTIEALPGIFAHVCTAAVYKTLFYWKILTKHDGETNRALVARFDSRH